MAGSEAVSQMPQICTSLRPNRVSPASRVANSGKELILGCWVKFIRGARSQRLERPVRGFRRLCGAADTHLQVANKSVCQRIDPTNHRELLAAFPCLPNDCRMAHIQNLLDYIQLAQT